MFSHFFSKPKNKNFSLLNLKMLEIFYECWFKICKIKTTVCPIAYVRGWVKKRGKYMYMGFNIIKICNMLKLKINILIYKCIYLYLKKIRKILKTVNFSKEFKKIKVDQLFCLLVRLLTKRPVFNNTQRIIYL